MGNVTSIIGQFKKERDRVERQLSGLNAALTAFAGAYGNKPVRKRRKMSVAARKKIPHAPPVAGYGTIVASVPKSPPATLPERLGSQAGQVSTDESRPRRLDLGAPGSLS